MVCFSLSEMNMISKGSGAVFMLLPICVVVGKVWKDTL